MTDRLNDRFIVPIGLPGTIFALAGIGVISLSRLLLAVSEKAAPLIVITVAAAVLGAFYLLSTRHVGRQALAALATVSAGLVLAAGVAGALKGERKFEAESGKAQYKIAAKNVAFDTKELKLPAATAFELEFDNEDPTQHNVAIYDRQGGKAVFTGKIVNKGTTVYKVAPLDAGTYYFQCDVHPGQMNGSVTVAQEASTAPKPGTNATTTSTIGS
jgi:plastocyanin